MFENVLFPAALGCGVSVSEYWNLTIGEIYKVIDAHNKSIEQSQQRDYTLAVMISTFVNLGLNGKQPPSYETMFTKPDKHEEKTSAKDNLAMALYCEQWIDFANRRNKLLKESKQHDN